MFVYFHGGGLERGDKARQTALYQYLTDHGVAVVAPNYRMYPAAHYPDFLADSAKAVAWTLDHIGTYGTATKIYVGGSSAGGYISQMLCFDETWLSPPTESSPPTLPDLYTMPGSPPAILMCCGNGGWIPEE